MLTLVLVIVGVAATYVVTQFTLASRRKPDDQGGAAKWQREAEARAHELQESLARQAATSEILRVISNSPTDLQPVLKTVAQNAAHLCDANDAAIIRVEGDRLRVVAEYGSLRDVPVEQLEQPPLRRDTTAGRAIIDRNIVHIPDLLL